MNNYVHRAGVNDDDEVPATSVPLDIVMPNDAEPANWANDPHGHAPYLGAKNGDQIRESQREQDLTKPLGVDVAGPIMETVRAVSDASRQRIQQIILRCNQLHQLIDQHEKDVEAELLRRDKLSRSVLTRHGELATLVNEEGKRTDAALDAIHEAFRGDE